MIPSYKDMMLPILEFVAQKKEANMWGGIENESEKF